MTLRRLSFEIALVVAASLTLSSGCNKAEKKECTQALFEGRSAARRDELELARQQLGLARQHCNERKQAHVDQLDQEIHAKEAQLDHLAEVEEWSAEAARELPARALVEWVSHQRAVADRAEKQTHCFSRGEARFGWCEGQRAGPGAAKFSVVYHQAESEAFRYRAELSVPVVCDDLDSHRVVRRWKAPMEGGTVERVHCEFLSKQLRGLSGLITTSGQASTVDIFSREYLNRDVRYRAVLEREGR